MQKEEVVMLTRAESAALVEILNDATIHERDRAIRDYFLERLTEPATKHALIDASYAARDCGDHED